MRKIDSATFGIVHQPLDGCAVGICSIKPTENLHHYLSLMKLNSYLPVFTALRARKRRPIRLRPQCGLLSNTTSDSHELLNQIHTAVNLC